jgi:hypothetical protein
MAAFGREYLLNRVVGCKTDLWSKLCLVTFHHHSNSFYSGFPKMGSNKKACAIPLAQAFSKI